MPKNQLHPRRAVTIVETTVFEDFAKKELSSVDHRGLHLILADNPLAGSAITGKDGLFALEYANCKIIYGLSPNHLAVYLLDGELNSKPPDPMPPKEDREIKELLKVLVKGGVFATGKKIVEAIIDGMS